MVIPPRTLTFPRTARLQLLILILATAGCRSGGGAADVDAVKALVGREVQAMNGRNLQALSQIWSQSPDAVLFDVAPPGRFQGWPAISRSFGDLFERTTEIQMTVASLEVRAEGGLAYASYDWTMSGKAGETALDDRGQATAIYRREKDGWKLVHAHYSALPPPAAPAPPAASGKKPAAPNAPAGKTGG